MVAALTRLDRALDLLGHHRGPCGLCGWPDARHRVAEAILGAFLAGDDTDSIVEDYGPGPGSERAATGEDMLMVALLALAADRRLHLVNKTTELAAAHAVRENKA